MMKKLNYRNDLKSMKNIVLLFLFFLLLSEKQGEKDRN
jgi:hypothetical protein